MNIKKQFFRPYKKIKKNPIKNDPHGLVKVKVFEKKINRKIEK